MALVRALGPYILLYVAAMLVLALLQMLVEAVVPKQKKKGHGSSAQQKSRARTSSRTDRGRDSKQNQANAPSRSKPPSKPKIQYEYVQRNGERFRSSVQAVDGRKQKVYEMWDKQNRAWGSRAEIVERQNAAMQKRRKERYG